MKFKKILKTFALFCISLSLLAVIFSIILDFFINRELPKIINDKNDTNYTFEYSKIDFSIYNNTLSIHDVVIAPKDLSLNADRNHYQAKINSIGVTGVNFKELLSQKKLKAHTIYVNEPNFTIFKSKINNQNLKKSKLPGSIDIDKITLSKANVSVYNSGADTLLQRLYNLNAKIDVLQMGDYIESKDLPFTYSDYKFTVDSIYSKLNEIHFIKANKIEIDKSNFTMNNFRIAQQEIIREIKNLHLNTKFEIKVPKVDLKGTDWGFKEHEFYIKLAQVNIDSVHFNILDKKKKLKENIKIAHSKVDSLKKQTSLIPFNLEIDELTIQNSSFNSLSVFDVQNVNIKLKGITNQIDQKLSIKEFTLNKPHIIQKKNKSKSQKQNAPMLLNNKIVIENFKIYDANYVLKDHQGKNDEIAIQKVNLSLEKISIDSLTSNNKIPFKYQNPKLKTGKVHYNTGAFYDVYIEKLDLKNNTINVSGLELKPKFSKDVFNSKIKYGTDWFDVTMKDITLKDLNWGFNTKNIFFIKCKDVILNQVNALIYRNAAIPNKPSFNKLYSQKLRDLKFGLDIENIKIINSNLIYQEENKKSLAAGSLNFKQFNASIKNIYSGQGRSSGPLTTIDVKTKFMESAKVNVIWSFNIMNKSDAFTIKGTVLNLSAQSMNPFIKPYMNVSANGQINEVAFDFNGNNKTASGNFAMNYENLKIDFYKKDGEKERKFITKVGNLAIKKNTKGKLIDHDTKSVEREQQKGFFNFFWLNLKQGLKQTLL